MFTLPQDRKRRENKEDRVPAHVRSCPRLQMENLLGADDRIPPAPFCSVCSREHGRSSLVVQGLRVYVLNTGGSDSLPGQGTRFHVLQLRLGTAK